MQSVNTARETANTMTPSPEAIKTAALNTCRNAIETCRGSGSIKTELSNLANACVNLPIAVTANSLKACTQFLTLQPVKATCTAAKGLTSACKDAAKIIVSPLPTGIATIKGTAKAGMKMIKFPVTGPLKVGKLAKNGIIRATDLMFGADTPAPANDNAESPSAPDSMPRVA